MIGAKFKDQLQSETKITQTNYIFIHWRSEPASTAISSFTLLLAWCFGVTIVPIFFLRPTGTKESYTVTHIFVVLTLSGNDGDLLHSPCGPYPQSSHRDNPVIGQLDQLLNYQSISNIIGLFHYLLNSNY